MKSECCSNKHSLLTKFLWYNLLVPDVEKSLSSIIFIFRYDQLSYVSNNFFKFEIVNFIILAFIIITLDQNFFASNQLITYFWNSKIVFTCLSHGTKCPKKQASCRPMRRHHVCWQRRVKRQCG